MITPFMEPIDLNKAKGAFYGAVLGDVIGVPFKHKPPGELFGIIPDIKGGGIKNKSHPSEPFGVWSDDTSLMLCIATGFLEQHAFLRVAINCMLSWRDNNAFTSTGRVFDIGNSTASSLEYLKTNNCMSTDTDEDAKGNGALMRTLPCAFFNFIEGAIVYAIVHTKATHNNMLNSCCVVFYTVLVWHIIRGMEFKTALQTTYEVVSDLEDYAEPLSEIIQFCSDTHNFQGTGYVVDSLGTSIFCAANTDGVIPAIQKAILFGNDTDTTAALAGGIAGAIHGFSDDLYTTSREVVNIELIDDIWEMLEKYIQSQNEMYVQ